MNGREKSRSIGVCLIALWTIVASVALLSGTASAQPADSCKKRILFVDYGWRDDCLVGLLRHASYLSISSAAASDAQLLLYVQSNEDDIALLLTSVDYGQDIAAYVYGKSKALPSHDDLTGLLSGVSMEFLKGAIDIAGHLVESGLVGPATEYFQFISSVAGGYDAYKKAADVISKAPTIQLLDYYFTDRGRNLPRSDAWAALRDDLEPLLALVAATNVNVRSDDVSLWFENAYQAYRLAGRPDSTDEQQRAAALRQEIGRVVAAGANPPHTATAAPSVTAVGQAGSGGIAFTVTAAFFKTGHQLQVFYRSPGAAHYVSLGPPQAVPAGASLSWTTTKSCQSTPGLVQSWQFVVRDLSDWLRGDFNGDGIVNSIDFSIMNASWFTNDPYVDLNGDGLVNTIDFSLVNANWFRTGFVTAASVGC